MSEVGELCWSTWYILPFSSHLQWYDLIEAGLVSWLPKVVIDGTGPPPGGLGDHSFFQYYNQPTIIAI
jgi:hypothetical protein